MNPEQFLILVPYLVREKLFVEKLLKNEISLLRIFITSHISFGSVCRDTLLNLLNINQSCGTWNLKRRV
jgi:hypothetical protein